MRAEIIRNDQGYTATFVRKLAHETGQVWAMLTENDKLKQWFPELAIEDLRKGGHMVFNMGNGAVEKMAILEYEEGKSIAFEWAEDEVLFEAVPENGGTKLVLVETISKITPHTARDLAGWHVCLDVIETILNGGEIARQDEWNKEYPEYQRLLDSMAGNVE